MLRRNGVRYLLCGLVAGACVMAAGCGDGQRIADLEKRVKELEGDIEKYQQERALDRVTIEAKANKIDNLTFKLQEARDKITKLEGDKGKSGADKGKTGADKGKADKAKADVSKKHEDSSKSSAKHSATGKKAAVSPAKKPAPATPPEERAIGD
ncbi:MAG: hypothetical protein C0404_07755 [Verrucomicrobia bacterium]|nr:hypothetical protein [Verrucomicrobiota bacterium]